MREKASVPDGPMLGCAAGTGRAPGRFPAHCQSQDTEAPLSDNRFDVAILGSGIGGSMLACILARHGVSTLLLEGASHPRFTIGESLIPETGIRLRMIAEKYGVPEIGWIASFHALRDKVSSNCGVKRSFGFMYHREGEENQPGEVNQFMTLTP